VTVLFDRDVEVDYGFVHVDSGVGGWDGEVDQQAGQRNGLLGAAQPGLLVVMTATNVGLVPVRVEAHDGVPPVDDTYDEIVEASCDLRGPEVSLSAFDWRTRFVLPQGGPHRVRLSVRDFQAGREQPRHELEEPVCDSYLLQLWPAEMAPDEIVKVTSPEAASWHREVRPDASATRSAHEQALAEQGQRDEAVRLQSAHVRQRHLQRWGGHDPSPRLLEAEQDALALTADHRVLVDALAGLPPDRQRALALDLAGGRARQPTVRWTGSPRSTPSRPADHSRHRSTTCTRSSASCSRARPRPRPRSRLRRARSCRRAASRCTSASPLSMSSRPPQLTTRWRRHCGP